MKKTIPALIALFLTFSVLILTACETAGDGSDSTGAPTGETSGKTAEDTTEEPTSETDDSNEKGDEKTALAMYQAAKKLLSDMSSYEITEEQRDADQTLITSGTVKLSGNDLYIHMDEQGAITEMTFLDGTLYMFSEGQKIKMTGVSIEDLLGGQDISDFANRGFFSFPDSKLADVVLEQNRDGYCFTLSFTAQEAEQYEFDSMSAGEITYYFDLDGVLTKTQSLQDGICETTSVSKINKPVTVTAPADAGSYLNPEIYSAYLRASMWMAEQNEYTLDYRDVEGYGTGITFQQDKQGDQFLDYAPGQLIYYVDGNYYISDFGDCKQVEPNEKITTQLEAAASMTDLYFDLLTYAQSVGVLKIEIIEQTEERVEIYMKLATGEEMTFSHGISLYNGVQTGYVSLSVKNPDGMESLSLSVNTPYTTNFDITLPDHYQP